MKVFVFIVVCIVAVAGQGSKLQNDEFDEKFKGYHSECVTELKLDSRKGKDALPPNPQEEICFQACFDKKTGMMNEDGSYNLERMKDLAGTPEAKQKAEKIYNEKIKNCQAEVGNDPCKMAGCAHGMPRQFWASKE